jgi:hypothetical protein
MLVCGAFPNRRISNFRLVDSESLQATELISPKDLFLGPKSPLGFRRLLW